VSTVDPRRRPAELHDRLVGSHVVAALPDEAAASHETGATEAVAGAL
jgi:hypothetical protein